MHTGSGRCLRPLSCLLCAASILAGSAVAPSRAWAQGGPPLLTDDPGTPGNGKWEVNISATQDLRREEQGYDLPILDVNYGIGRRVELNYQLPYILTGTPGNALEGGLGNSFAGVKWRFYQTDERGWNLSTYPQIEFNNPTSSLRHNLVDRGPSVLLPIEVTKAWGPMGLNLEAGYGWARVAREQYILGLAIGHQFMPRLELLAEFYATDVGNEPDQTIDSGGRYSLLDGRLLLLFMAGRSVHGSRSGQSQFIGYFGVQVHTDSDRARHLKAVGNNGRQP